MDVCELIVDHHVASRSSAEVVLRGELVGTSTVEVLANRLSFLAALLDPGAICRLALEEVHSIDQRGVEALRECIAEATSHGIAIRFVGPSENVRSVIESSRLGSHLSE
jgi:ABC-type transporter Mla MlaB component